MKLQYNTVDQNIKDINEKVSTYNQMVLLGDREKAAEIYLDILSLFSAFKSSLYNKHVASTEDIGINSEEHGYIAVYLRGTRKLDL